MNAKESIEVKREGPPRWVTVLLAFIVLANVAAALWLQLLPRPNEVAKYLLEADAGENPVQLAIQVDIGRAYQRRYEKLSTAAGVVKFWLAVSAFAWLCTLAIVDAERLRFNRKKPDKVAD